MTNQRAIKDVARRPEPSGARRRAVVMAAAAALGMLVAAGGVAGQDIGPGLPQPPAGAAGQPYPNGAAGQPYPGQPPAAAPAPAPDGSAAPAESNGPMVAAGPSTTQPATPLAAGGGDTAIHLEAGRSAIVRLPRAATEISNGSPDLLAWNFPKNSDGTNDLRSLLLTGKKAGSTVLVVIDDANRRTLYDVTIDPDFAALRTQLREAFPGVAVRASALNDSIALRGTVPSDKIAAQIVEMAGTFGKVHNFTEVAGGQQVMLQIRFAEVDRSVQRNLGINFGGTDGVTSFGNNVGQVSPFGLITGTAAPALAFTSPTSGVTLFGSGAFGRSSFAYFIQALEQNGLVRELAEPNVVAINGQEASFIAGGEFPVPVSQGGTGSSAAVTVQYQEYGIRLNFTPLVLGNGTIRLKVAPEVSELDYSNAVQSNGFLIPALTKRKVSTTVELGDGQSFALAGLMSDTTSATTDAVPLLGDVPVLGMLFRSTKYQRQQTELVVLVTPHLVGATDPDTTAALPGEHWRFPTDAAAYFTWDLGGDQRKPAKDGRPGADKNLEAAVPPRTFHGTYGFTPNGSGSVDVPGGR